MKICLVGKYPPIQGGVSGRTYWIAQLLAAMGHEIHVVTNAKEVGTRFRIFMRDEDWAECEMEFGEGRVVVHWTDPSDFSQAYIPRSNSFVTKLSSLALKEHAKSPFDLVFSYYLEPYSVAGHLVSKTINRPHVVKMAGSDAGKLWHHPQFEPLYDEVLRSASIVLTGGKARTRAIDKDLPPASVMFDGGFSLSERLFSPDGPKLNIGQLVEAAKSDATFAETVWGGQLAGRPRIGVYGKLGPKKGSLELLHAIAKVRGGGHEVNLLVMAHGRGAFEQEFRDLANELGLGDCVQQLPFLPHWRVPEFLRLCDAVCCLEQDFPIEMHTPIVAREILLCGNRLVASQEMINKLGASGSQDDNRDYLAVQDVTDINELANALVKALDVRIDEEHRQSGRETAMAIQADIDFPLSLEEILSLAATRR